MLFRSIKGTTEGTITDINGAFQLTTTLATPFKLVVTMVGMTTSEMDIDGNKDDLNVKLSEETSLLSGVVVAASRVEEKILESPVTIEKMDQKAIKASSSSDYYDDLSKLKGVQTINGSMTLTSINTRGFGGISNTRFVQLMDGMDNAAPLLNFPTGNIVGIGELDINNVELVPGAASALYGPNAFNGILLMNSKNPFENPGFSMQVKGGFSQADNNYGVKPMGSASMRLAHAFKNKNTGKDFMAFKANFSIFQGTDWSANDYTTDRNLHTMNNVGQPNFDGMNTYGDENRIFVPYGAVRGNLIGGASMSLQNSPLFKAAVTAGVTAQVNAQLPAITAGVTAAVRQNAYNQAIGGGADDVARGLHLGRAIDVAHRDRARMPRPPGAEAVGGAAAGERAAGAGGGPRAPPPSTGRATPVGRGANRRRRRAQRRSTPWPFRRRRHDHRGRRRDRGRGRARPRRQAARRRMADAWPHRRQRPDARRRIGRLRPPRRCVAARRPPAPREVAGRAGDRSTCGGACRRGAAGGRRTPAFADGRRALPGRRLRLGRCGPAAPGPRSPVPAAGRQPGAGPLRAAGRCGSGGVGGAPGAGHALGALAAGLSAKPGPRPAPMGTCRTQPPHPGPGAGPPLGGCLAGAAAGTAHPAAGGAGADRTGRRSVRRWRLCAPAVTFPSLPETAR